MRSSLILLPVLVALSVTSPTLAIPYSSLALSSASDMAPFLAPESGLSADPVSATIYAAARLLNDQGIAHLNQKLQAHAEADFTRAIAMAPGAWALYANRAAAYSRRHNYAAALKDIDTALQLSPVNATLLVRRANLYVADKKYDKAKVDLDRAVDIMPGSAGLLAQRAMVQLLYLDDRAAALADFALARSIDPDHADVRRAESLLSGPARADIKSCDNGLTNQSSCGLTMITPNASISERQREAAAAAIALQKAEQAALAR